MLKRRIIILIVPMLLALYFISSCDLNIFKTQSTNPINNSTNVLTTPTMSNTNDNSVSTSEVNIQPTITTPDISSTYIHTTSKLYIDLSGLYINEDNCVVNSNFELPSKYLSYDLTWQSSEPQLAAISIENESIYCIINRNTITTQVKLTASCGDSSKDFFIKIIGIDSDEIADNFRFIYDKETLISGNYSLPTSTVYFNIKANISWSIDSEYSDYANIENDELIITAPQDKEETIFINATFYVSDLDYCTIHYRIYAYDEKEEIYIATKLEQNKPYLLYINHITKEQDLYFTGNLSGYYGETTSEISKAKQIYIEQVDEGYYLTFKDEEDFKKYINLSINGTYCNIKLDDEPLTIWTWDEVNNTIKGIASNGKSYYIGCNKNFSTIQPLIDISSNYPIKFAADNSEITKPLTNVEYNFVVNQETLGETLYFTGNMSGYYDTTTSNKIEACSLVLEESSSGYYISLNIDGNKLYLNYYKSGYYVNIWLYESPLTVWTWDSEYNTLVTNVDDSVYYICTFGSFKTLSLYKINDSSTSYIVYLTYHYNDIIEDNMEK